jgi:L-threonylcarbamoyladenylate synthase
LSGRIDVLLVAGPCPGGLESSVVDLSSNTPRLLRPGLITAEQISAIIGPLATTSRDTDTAPLPSPGLLDRHYAPRAILECADDDGAARVNALRAEGRRIGWLRLGVVDDASADPLTLTLPPDPAAYSAGLYAALHALDAAAPERIIAALPPDTPEWLAVRDRLRRASQP